MGLAWLFSSKTPEEEKSPPTKKRPEQVISPEENAIFTIKLQRDELHRYETKAQAVIKREIEAAKQKLKEGNRKLALLILKKKKYQESLLEKAKLQLANLTELIDQMEFAVIQKKVFDGLKLGKDTLKELNDQMKLEDVEKLLEETHEGILYQQEMDELLKGKFNSEDEEELTEELDELISLDKLAKLPSIPKTSEPLEDSKDSDQEEEEEKEKESDLLPKKQKLEAVESI
eukprot:TRINITY_DN36730_c0_g2_i2.p1 TRINITY_DN36730_c0_g2~~TRINITY_DN36730_c0_g2_i2.p1  ORF type:complete len:231 (+),score=45.80 TRINITY_DN36730_c0_g2_i2:112-804(+)